MATTTSTTESTATPAAQPELNVVCIGAGYVGGPTMAVIAKHCPRCTVTVVDIDANKIEAWNSDFLPIYEPGLKELVTRCRNVNLFFSTDVDSAIKKADVIFIAVATPTKEYGIGAGCAYDLTAWESVARSIARSAESSKIIVEKSTVPVRTAEKVRLILESNKRQGVGAIRFDVLSNPEFLAEGCAIQNLEHPDRVLLGGPETPEGARAVAAVASIYKQWVPSERVLTTNVWSAELSKLTANAFLAQRISSVNALSAICEVTGADVEQVTRVIGTDERLGPHFLRCSVGFGGSCFKKDILGLVYLCEQYQLNEVAEYWRQIVLMNEYQKRRFAMRIFSTMFGTVRGKKIALLGYAFKKNTGDIRESPAITVSQFLLDEGAKLQVYDPKAKIEDIHGLGPQFKSIVGHPSAAAAAVGADALVVLTEWDEFKTLDYAAIFETMRKPAFVFDGRNILDHAALTKIGFLVHGVGQRSEAVDTSAH